ncbi:MAG: phytanoyl-CoA dioxygenase family protein [Geminicoccales bacterium]
MTREALIDTDEIDTFRRDGVVGLRQAFAPEWIDMLRDAIDQSMAKPSGNFTRHTKDPNAPGYFEDFWSWSRYPGFEQFVRQSPVAPLAAELLGAQKINLVMDNWFLREAGSTSRPPFHHDISYFDFTGRMCVLWLPLEPVSKANGLTFVKGSHLWNKLFLRTRFADGHQTGGRVTEVNGERYEPTPDIEADAEAYDLIQFDLDLGDCLYFDMRTLHGGLSSVTPSETLRRYTLRMTAEDGMIRYRGDWAIEERRMIEAAGYKDGDRIEGDFFPKLWPA